MRRLMLLALVVWGLAVVAVPASAQQAPPAADTATSTPWSSLNPDARQMLAPLKAKWSRISPRHQQHLIDKARRWETLPEKRRQAIRDRIQHWQQMSPAERGRARANRRIYRSLPKQERRQLHAAYRHFQQLPPAQREKVLKQWHSMSVTQRQQWIEQHRALHPSTRATDGDQ